MFNENTLGTMPNWNINGLLYNKQFCTEEWLVQCRAQSWHLSSVLFRIIALGIFGTLQKSKVKTVV